MYFFLGASTGSTSSGSLVTNNILILIIVWNVIISISFVLLCLVLFKWNQFPSNQISTGDEEASKKASTKNNSIYDPYVHYVDSVDNLNVPEEKVNNTKKEASQQNSSFNYSKIVHSDNYNNYDMTSHKRNKEEKRVKKDRSTPRPEGEPRKLKKTSSKNEDSVLSTRQVSLAPPKIYFDGVLDQSAISSVRTERRDAQPDGSSLEGRKNTKEKRANYFDN